MASGSGRYRRPDWPWVLAMVAAIVLVIVIVATTGCSLHVHLMEKHYHREPPASSAAEERILDAFGVNDDKATVEE